MKPASIDWSRADPAPLSIGVDMRAADISTCESLRRAAQPSTDPHWAQQLMDEAQLLEIRALGT